MRKEVRKTAPTEGGANRTTESILQKLSEMKMKMAPKVNLNPTSGMNN
jgi:hypothetical protein